MRRETQSITEKAIPITPKMAPTSLVTGAILYQNLDFEDSKSKERLEIRLSSSSNLARVAVSRDDKDLFDCYK